MSSEAKGYSKWAADNEENVLRKKKNEHIWMSWKIKMALRTDHCIWKCVSWSLSKSYFHGGKNRNLPGKHSKQKRGIKAICVYNDYEFFQWKGNLEIRW